ncbi:MAG TPA: HXXEE domain-containing protein [Aggregatilineales bacterium]|nr:HXXEE domain-containing protein [Aggregatilineales bacterium]
MKSQDSLYRWAIANWAKASLPMGGVLVLLSPLLARGIPMEAVLIFLLLPVYMFHQYEEHAQGQFRAFVNKHIGRGREVFDDQDIFWINMLGVWLINLVGLYLSVYVGLANGLVLAYLTVVNGLLHVAIAIVLRAYNPGLWTGLLLFLPLGGFTLVAITEATGAGLGQHVLALGTAILLHVAIILYARQKLFLASGRGRRR